MQDSDDQTSGSVAPLYLQYREFREQAGIHVVAAPGGPRHCLSRYADVAAALKDARFGAAPASPVLLRALRGIGLGGLADVIASGMLVALNPPDHTRLRKVLDPFFHGKALERLKPRVEEIVEDLFHCVEKTGRFDLIADFAAPLPTYIIAELFGFSKEEAPRLKQWSHDLAPLIDSELQRSSLLRRITAFLAFRRRIKKVLEERWREPRDDLLSALAQAHHGTGELSQAEAVGTVIFVLIAGHATTTHLIGSSMQLLLDHPEELSRLRADPILIDRVLEEALRMESPIQRTGRVLLEEIELHGQRLPRGTKIRLMIGAANRDPRRFENPDQFDLSRPDNRHVGFGGGIHQCIGLHLARLEAKLALGTLVRRFPQLERVGEDLRWVPGTKFRGLAELAVRV